MEIKLPFARGHSFYFDKRGVVLEGRVDPLFEIRSIFEFLDVFFSTDERIDKMDLKPIYGIVSENKEHYLSFEPVTSEKDGWVVRDKFDDAIIEVFEEL